ncbi:terpene synthase 10 isoform X2 [Ziziphus jujuba]|uniref:Terpene synthase 10 isoform X2 n=1 Tax=Ziziphus jujuba TaxID=326968 RepID=A0ABM3ICB4_ZIZJJ|nr:terpene synthase 10 isoform X2 [Ziziphus jujuba]
MANHLVASLPISMPRVHISSLAISKSTSSSTGLVLAQAHQQCSMKTAFQPPKTTKDIARRSANYKPTIWNFDYIHSLSNNYVGETYSKRAEEPKEQVRAIIEEAVDDPLLQLNLIDTLQRLGLSYHFQDHIHTILKAMHNTQAWRNEIINNNLYATALDFRLLRQHGYWVPQEVFNGFKEGGTFKACLSEDTEGMLSLYEASYHSVEGESTLEEAKDFTTKHLKQYIQNKKLDDQNEQLSILVTHALELPLHWRTPRLETRWFIDVYHTTKHMNPIILELAKLDYNMVQSTHQEDLKHAYRWWSNTGLVPKLSFARDRLVENFLWSMEMISEPQFGYCRRMSTRILSLITTIDDIYDLYGTLDELELFTNAVQRWDMNEMDGLPDYMKLCFLALHNSINEMAFDVLKNREFHIIKYLKNSEAKLYYSGYTPTLQEYIENAWVSISAPLVLVHAYFFLNNPITQEELQRLEEYSGIIRSSAIVLRLADDLGTSSDELKRGDVPKAMQCYMHESCASEEDAYEHIKFLIEKMWKKMNEDSGYAKSAGNIYSETFIRSAMNLTRMAQCIYLYGDGYGVQDRHTKDNVLSSVIEPIPL